MSISLNDMSRLARMLIEADNRVSDAEVEVKRVKERARELREETIPCAMQELGLPELKLDTGEKLTIKLEVYASIPSANKNEAYSWLEENGFGGLIKTEVTTKYNKEESELANALVRELAERGLSVSLKKGVHAQTLKAFLREQISSGKNIPLDIFGARPVWAAKIK